MSGNFQSDKINLCSSDDQTLANSELQQILLATGEELTNVTQDKQQLLVEKANSTFRELWKTLENEQTKLLELENRRKILQEEMLFLKAEIEDEKRTFNLKIVESVAENLSYLNNASANKDCDQSQFVDKVQMKNSYTCHEEEEPQPVTARKLTGKDSQELIKQVQ